MHCLPTDKPELKIIQADPSYAEEIFCLVQKNREFLKEWLPWVDQIQSADDTRLFLTTCRQQYAMQKQFTVLMQVNGKIIGIAGFNELNHANHRGEIGYWMAEEAQGNGYTTVAVQKLIELGFQNFDLNRQVIKAASGNLPSNLTALRLGFKYEGTERQASCLRGEFQDLNVYSLLRSDWNNRT